MPEGSYHVLWLSDARNTLRELAQKARERGVLESFKLAITELNERLEREPIEVGELYRTRGNIEDHSAAYKVVSIDFGVDKERKVVCVRWCVEFPRGGS